MIRVTRRHFSYSLWNWNFPLNISNNNSMLIEYWKHQKIYWADNNLAVHKITYKLTKALAKLTCYYGQYTDSQCTVGISNFHVLFRSFTSFLWMYMSTSWSFHLFFHQISFPLVSLKNRLPFLLCAQHTSVVYSWLRLQHQVLWTLNGFLIN